MTSSNSSHEQSTLPGLAAHVPSSSMITGEPGVDVNQKAAAIHLISTEEMSVCSFWIGLFQRGQLTSPELFDKGHVNEIFQQAATHGLRETTPVMLSDTSMNPPRFIYLLPEPSASSRADGSWIKQLVSTVQSWSPKKIGIYLAPELVNQETIQELLMQMMDEMVRVSDISDYYLISATHGLNALLNTAIKIKSQLDQEKFNVLVFH
jgi:hypothetical protein